jgi:hypothetical protein
MIDASQPPQPLLRRILLRTKPVPLPIWMAGLALVAFSPATLFGWAIHPEASARTVLLIQLFMCCLGGLMGLFAARMVGRSWFATFGECIEVPSEYHAKHHIALQIGFALALITLIAIFTQLLIGIV